MPNMMLDGFSDELLKLAVGDIYPDPEDPNIPWRADSEARGLKHTAKLPSRVPTGHLGSVGASSKSEGTNDGYTRGSEQTGDTPTD